GLTTIIFSWGQSQEAQTPVCKCRGRSSVNERRSSDSNELVTRRHQKVSGGNSGGATPDPIPNSEVKPSRADGTAGGTLWESRSPPGNNSPKAGGRKLLPACVISVDAARSARLRAFGGAGDYAVPLDVALAGH